MGVVTGVDGVVVTAGVAAVDVEDGSGVVIAVLPPGAFVVGVAVALAAAMTPHATRLPASPVAIVAASGPGTPFTE